MLRQDNKHWLSSLSVPLISIICGFILGAIVMLIFGYNPIKAYDAMIMSVFKNPYFFGEALRQATVLTFTGLSFNIAYQAGFFNIGVAGQLLMGWMASIWLGLLLPELPRVVMLPILLLVGALFGALWSAIAGVLKAYFGTNEVIVTIMLNYTALHATNHLIRNVIATGNISDRVGVNASLAVGWLTSLTNGSRLNIGLFIAIAVVALYWFVMKHTTVGFELRAVGLNKDAAEYAGMSAKKNIILSMFISGALAGLGGAIHGLGTFGNIFTQGHLPPEGFDGIAVGLLGLGTPVGTFLSAILFGILNIGSAFMPNMAGVPDELAQVVTASIIFFIGANYIIRYFINKRVGKGDKKQGGDTV